jgi:signal transduction histidine kinase
VASASNGSALQITHAARAPLPAQLAAPAPFAAPAVALSDVAADGASWRLALASTEPMRVAIALDNRALAADMVVVRNAFLMAVPPTLLLIALGTWLVAARALRPVDDLTATIRRVSAQGLSERVAASASDSEFAELIGVFNAMLERLERGFHQASRFSADAAHELKTPLAIMQGELERRIGQSETGSETQVAYTRLLDEVTRLSIISRKLLMLSLADAGRLKLDRQPLDMTELLNGLTEDARMLAPELRVTSDIPAGLRVSADHNLIQQILHNLVSNAIKFNTPDGWIHITASRSANEVFVSVSNASHGIDPADARRVFERFYRGDPAHGRAVDGVGLGLSLSREIARAHGGDLTLETGQDARVFLQLVLPDLPNRLH